MPEHTPALFERVPRSLFGPLGDLTIIENEYPFLSYIEQADGPAGLAADTWADEAPVLAGLAAASVQGIGALAFVAWATICQRRLRRPRTTAVTRGIRCAAFDWPMAVVC